MRPNSRARPSPSGRLAKPCQLARVRLGHQNRPHMLPASIMAPEVPRVAEMSLPLPDVSLG